MKKGMNLIVSFISLGLLVFILLLVFLLSNNGKNNSKNITETITTTEIINGTKVNCYKYYEVDNHSIEKIYSFIYTNEGSIDKEYLIVNDNITDSETEFIDNIESIVEYNNLVLEEESDLQRKYKVDYKLSDPPMYIGTIDDYKKFIIHNTEFEVCY